MCTHSKDGREWAKLSALKAGSKVILDGDFTCGIAGETLVVEEHEKYGLYVPCIEGRHFLSGRASNVDGDHLVGVWPA